MLKKQQDWNERLLIIAGCSLGIALKPGCIHKAMVRGCQRRYSTLGWGKSGWKPGGKGPGGVLVNSS